MFGKFLIFSKFTSVEPKQLYDSMQEVLVLRNETKVLHGMTINEFMTNWEFTPGLPIVTASLDYDTGCLTLSQVGNKFKTNESFYNNQCFLISKAPPLTTLLI